MVRTVHRIENIAFSGELSDLLLITCGAISRLWPSAVFVNPYNGSYIRLKSGLYVENKKLLSEVTSVHAFDTSETFDWYNSGMNLRIGMGCIGINPTLSNYGWALNAEAELDEDAVNPLILISHVLGVMQWLGSTAR